MDDLLSLTDDPGAARPLTAERDVLFLSGAEDDQMVRAYVIDFFGGDDAHDHLRLVVGSTDRGVLRREAAQQLALPGDRGGVGTGDYGTLTGLSPHYVILDLICPLEEDRPVARALSYNEESPPQCPRHHIPLRVAAR
jgi:hypothetical protein